MTHPLNDKRSQLATDDQARVQCRNIAESDLVVARAEFAREEQHIREQK